MWGQRAYALKGASHLGCKDLLVLEVSVTRDANAQSDRDPALVTDVFIVAQWGAPA